MAGFVPFTLELPSHEFGSVHFRLDVLGEVRLPVRCVGPLPLPAIRTLSCNCRVVGCPEVLPTTGIVHQRSQSPLIGCYTLSEHAHGVNVCHDVKGDGCKPAIEPLMHEFQGFVAHRFSVLDGEELRVMDTDLGN